MRGRHGTHQTTAIDCGHDIVEQIDATIFIRQRVVRSGDFYFQVEAHWSIARPPRCGGISGSAMTRAKANASTSRIIFVSIPAPLVTRGCIRAANFLSTQNECPGLSPVERRFYLYLGNLERCTLLISQVREFFYVRNHQLTKL